jgi:hypothetical protein
LLIVWILLWERDRSSVGGMIGVRTGLLRMAVAAFSARCAFLLGLTTL